jgi:hypothetical protein
MGESVRYVEGQVVDATTICASFPIAPPLEIPRDNILYTLEEMLGGEIQIVSVEGKEESGKTTLLAQFAKRHPKAALSVFVRPGSRFSYDPEVVLRDLCHQACWILTERELPTDTDEDEARFRRLTYDLQKRARQTNTKFFWVIDGLENLPADSVQARHLILSLLPLETPQFRFLITGSYDAITGIVGRRVASKPFALPGFTVDETARYFEGAGLSREAINELDRTFRGVPGRLASAKRILESGTKPEALLETLPSRIPDLFEMEWRTL